MRGRSTTTTGTGNRRAKLLVTAALSLLLHAGLGTAVLAAGGTGGTGTAGMPGSGSGGSGGSATGGAGGTSANGGNTGTGGAGGTAYKGVGSFAGSGGGGGGSGTVGAPPGLPGAGGVGAGLDAAGAGPANFNNSAPLQGTVGGTPGGDVVVFGGAGGGAGGPGAIATGAGPSSNTSTINGGAGGASAGATVMVGGGGGGAGGIGVLLTAAGAQFSNSGTIAGGAGGNGGGSTVVFGGGGGGAGGIGVLFSAGNASFVNSGTVTGGNGGTPGGAIVIQGGGGGGEGGTGALFVGDRVSITNSGTVTGGAGGGGEGSTVTFGGGGGGAGGAALLVVGNNVSIANSGTLTGGAGGGAGNAILFAGGGGGGEGGAAVLVQGNRVSFTNSGTVTGGNGGGNGSALASFGDGGTGDGGAAARFVGNDVRVTNSGTITGGAGGSEGGALLRVGAGAAGNGGAGIQFLGSGARLDNSGTVSGGNGGVSSGGNGVGGIGVLMSGGIIENTGSINGGLAGDGVTRALAIVLAGGENFVGGPGQINGGIDVQATALFQPAVPGSPAGAQPLSINGPLNFASTSIYQVRVGTNQADRVLVNGVATLNGATVNVAAAPVAYRPGVSRYLILNASGGVNGRFGDLTGGSLFLRPVGLSYPDANDVFLTTRKLPFEPSALTWNQRAVAGGLDNANRIASNRTGQGGKILGALNVLTNATQFRAVLDSLSGEGVTAAQNVAFRSTELFTSSIFDQTTFYTGGGAANSVTLTERVPGLPAFLSLAPTERAPIRELADLPAARVEPAVAVPVANRTWRAWATGWGGTEHISGNAFPIGSATQNNSLYGGSLGVDYQLLPNYLVGVALGGSNGDFRVDQRGTSGSSTGGHVAIYDLLTLGNWYGASSTSFSYFGNKTNRFVNGFGGLGSETLRGDFDSHEFRTRLEVGRHFSSLPTFGALPAFTGFGTVTPFVALEIAELRSNGFTETALRGPGLFRLNVSGQTAASAPGFVGLRFQKVTPLGNGMVLSPTLQLAYVHEFAPYRTQVGTIAALAGSTFLVDGARPARDAAQVKAGAELALGPHSAVFANFDGEFSGLNQLYAGKGGFRYTW